MGESNGASFKVVYSGAARQTLKKLLLRATTAGFGPEALKALRRIDQKLHHGPLDFGDPQAHYEYLHLVGRVGVEPPLAVYYAVHEKQSLVFVNSFEPYPADAF